MLDGTEGSLKESLRELVWFAKLSGLTYNYSKTQVIWIGFNACNNRVFTTVILPIIALDHCLLDYIFYLKDVFLII
jgi:hypothetical protein